MNVKDSEKCINPWLGLLIITSICIVMATAIFYEFKGPGKKGKHKVFNKKQNASVPAAFTVNGQNKMDMTQDKIIF